MKIDRLILRGFRGFEDLDLPLDPQLTVLFGVNGSGKSAILDALAILLSWIPARVRHSRGSGRTIRDLDVNRTAPKATIKAIASQPAALEWQLVKIRRGYSGGPTGSELGQISRYAKKIQQQIEETQARCIIPLFAYYPVDRAVVDIPLRISKSHKFSLLDAWDESLVSAANFRHFFEWFRNREDLENENFRLSLVPVRSTPEVRECPDRQLEGVRRALKAFLPGFSDFSVRRDPLRMVVVVKRRMEIRVDQLSDGEKCMIALVGDLARRLAIANPRSANPLEGHGVVLIDEIDLHLHPAWQRMILPKLTKTFPNCQFVVSTHSPQAVGEVPAEQLRLLMVDEQNRFSYEIPRQSLGLTTNEILAELMQTLTRNQEVEEQLDELSRLIDRERFDEARQEIDRLKKQLHGDIPDLVHARAVLDMLDVQREG